MSAAPFTCSAGLVERGGSTSLACCLSTCGSFQRRSSIRTYIAINCDIREEQMKDQSEMHDTAEQQNIGSLTAWLYSACAQHSVKGRMLSSKVGCK